jgi:hypothetical protein
MGQVMAVLDWMKDHDLPNWATLLFSLIVWPSVLYWWSRRKVKGIPHLEVQPQKKDTIRMDGQSYDAVYLIFKNGTGSVVYLSRARLRGTKRFPIPAAAVRGFQAGTN